MAFRPFSREDIIARLKGTSLGNVGGDFDPRMTTFENAGVESVFGRPDTDWPDTAFGKNEGNQPYTAPTSSIGSVDPLNPPSPLPDSYPAGPTYNPDMDIPGVG